MLKSILLVLVLLTHIDATHFQGGTITYKVLNTSGSTVSILLTQTYLYDYAKISCNDSMIANQWPPLYFNSSTFYENNQTVQCIQYCNQSGGFVGPSVISNCIDYSSALGITVGQRSDVINISNGSDFVVAYQSAAWRKLSLPGSAGTSTAYWSIASKIDLRLRSNGRYNTAPVALMISPIYIPVGIEQAIAIPTIDADNDQVRCRFAQGISECGSTCPPSSLPNGTTILPNCTLLITGIKVADWYAVTIEVSANDRVFFRPPPVEEHSQMGDSFNESERGRERSNAFLSRFVYFHYDVFSSGKSRVRKHFTGERSDRLDRRFCRLDVNNAIQYNSSAVFDQCAECILVHSTTLSD